MNADGTSFFSSVISAGAILSGFCGTFLSFRLQREANYFRMPVADLDHPTGSSRDINQTHFTSALFLLLLGTLTSVVFGFLIPLMALAGISGAQNLATAVVSGLAAALVLIATYFLDELVHYRIFWPGRLLQDIGEWEGEWGIVATGLIAASVVAMLVICKIR
jgi:hypothetical protein